MTKNDGGPAFPFDETQVMPQNTGLSIRDWFAGQALGGDLAGQSPEAKALWGEIQFAQSASAYYRMADAMLKEREDEE